MFRRSRQISALQLQKQLLIVESEINRVRLLEAGQALADGCNRLAHQARSFGVVASATMTLVAGFAALKNSRPSSAVSKSTWYEKIAGGARLAVAIWAMFRLRSTAAEKE